MWQKKERDENSPSFAIWSNSENRCAEAKIRITVSKNTVTPVKSRCKKNLFNMWRGELSKTRIAKKNNWRQILSDHSQTTFASPLSLSHYISITKIIRLLSSF